MTDFRDRWRLAPAWVKVACLTLAYLAAHVSLDWISFIHEVSPLNVTPWNPPSGLIMGMSLVFGVRAAPLVWLGLMASDLVVRGLPVALWATMTANAVVAAGYGAAGWMLRERLGLDPGLPRLRDVVLLLAGGAGTAMAAGAGYIAIHTMIGLFPWSGFPDALLRYWVGEIIGIAVLTPLVLVGLRGPALRVSWAGAAEVGAQGLLIAFALWLDFGPLGSAQYEHFYLLFLPAVAIAVRHGLPGAALASVITQAGLIVAVQATGVETARMTHFQLLMLTLAVTALLLGTVVSERRRVEAWVRERQSDLAGAARLTEAGEMAAALAHELNQPLSAAMSYARAARKIARLEETSPRLGEILDKTVAQTERADRVIRSLRDFVRKGRSERSPLPVAGLVADCVTLAGPLATRHRVSIAAEVAPGLPPVRGDAVQLQQVILNLVRNAAEAMAEGMAEGIEVPGPRNRRIVLFAHLAGEADAVVIGVRDSGPGLAGVVERNLFAPFVTTKATGMGLGLSIARTLVEGHGGSLTGRRLPHGETVFEFTIPVHGNDAGEAAG
ncbi:MASE1 domain-containing protein [Azospirillum doebereinerae]|uniref:MASE1 domain-containing protein n=1 Tax=Azospirillum doebereinerae TaxID=92933 RepID=UPI001EE5BFE7|nr:MASE1 domain-containing protein [Azospirillum doebereinerae]MCG5239910.1 MASE1 domain-containing protein [Azospirillum doebereinerae]